MAPRPSPTSPDPQHKSFLCRAQAFALLSIAVVGIAFGGSPYRATKRVKCVCVCVPKVGGDACGRSHWGPRWRSLWGHETCEGCADMGMGGAAIRTSPLEPSVTLSMGPRSA
eukprot:4448691-Pyramimonas_sp.AAC.2